MGDDFYKKNKYMFKVTLIFTLKNINFKKHRGMMLFKMKIYLFCLKDIKIIMINH
jgi:hypothetical protein